MHFANILNITKAYLDTIHIQNDLENITASGYLLSNAHLKQILMILFHQEKLLLEKEILQIKTLGCCSMIFTQTCSLTIIYLKS